MAVIVNAAHTKGSKRHGPRHSSTIVRHIVRTRPITQLHQRGVIWQ